MNKILLAQENLFNQILFRKVLNHLKVMRENKILIQMDRALESKKMMMKLKVRVYIQILKEHRKLDNQLKVE